MAMEQLEKMKQELIEAGKLGPDEEIDRMELISRWSSLKMGGLPKRVPKKKKEKKPARPREGYKYALRKLLNLATENDSCMLVTGGGWINFFYSRGKDQMWCQVAGNKYIAPLKLDEKRIKKLEKMGFPADEYSIDIFIGRFDGKDRNIEKITDTIFTIVNDIYQVEKGADSYINLVLTTETERTKAAIAGLGDYVDYRDGKKFCFGWNPDA